MNCPQGCVSPIRGEDTLREQEERVPLDIPRVVEHMGQAEVVDYETRRFLECSVCGWVVDI